MGKLKFGNLSPLSLLTAKRVRIYQYRWKFLRLVGFESHPLRLAKRAGAKFHTELHKLRKTGASRRYLKGVPLSTFMQELGHESLATTQDYLANVRRQDETKNAVADADFVQKPRLVTGTGAD
jgi:integrase